MIDVDEMELSLDDLDTSDTDAGDDGPAGIEITWGAPTEPSAASDDDGDELVWDLPVDDEPAPAPAQPSAPAPVVDAEMTWAMPAGSRSRNRRPARRSLMIRSRIRRR